MEVMKVKGYKCVCDAAKLGDWWRPGWVMWEPQCSYCKPVFVPLKKVHREPS